MRTTNTIKSYYFTLENNAYGSKNEHCIPYRKNKTTEWINTKITVYDVVYMAH